MTARLSPVMEELEEGELLTPEDITDTEAEEEEDGSTGPPSPLDSQPQGLLPPQEAAPERTPRWDQKLKDSGKTPAHPSRSAGRSYRSWRAHKSKILNCLWACRGNVAFTRRYMLFKQGVNIPNNVIHYYNSRYHSAAYAETAPAFQSAARGGGGATATPESRAAPSPLSPAADTRPPHAAAGRGGGGTPSHPAPEESDLPHSLCHLPAEQRVPHGAKN
ncbi:encapsidation protein [Equine adenovirus 1]|uniref:Encapsidation protein n=1 Tax=Equine adenovirus A serotype 1 TaxID=46916 RepID=G5CZ91_ADEE1|nr:encapsidation protein [Equine adenovirus 1]AEP16421.1 encapsidation protein [Equine adenovirus 1]